jgi:hypothetical protein
MARTRPAGAGDEEPCVPVMFPKWMNALPTLGALGAVGGLCTVVGGVWYWATPEFWEVGYMPTQPYAGFNHQIHAGKLGLDCRYCHSHVEESAEANIPTMLTCMGCHAEGHLNNDLEVKIGEKVKFIREKYAADESVPWHRVHKLPDYVRNFPHNVHVKAGVSCFSCHGQITGMPVVYQHESISMSWCLNCHRDVQKHPELHLVDPKMVTQLKWVEEKWFSNPAEHKDEAQRLLESIRQAPPENCGACHY